MPPTVQEATRASRSTVRRDEESLSCADVAVMSYPLVDNGRRCASTSEKVCRRARMDWQRVCCQASHARSGARVDLPCSWISEGAPPWPRDRSMAGDGGAFAMGIRWASCLLIISVPGTAEQGARIVRLRTATHPGTPGTEMPGASVVPTPPRTRPAAGAGSSVASKDGQSP